jgi:hypothetical protein
LLTSIATLEDDDDDDGCTFSHADEALRIAP